MMGLFETMTAPFIISIVIFIKEDFHIPQNITSEENKALVIMTVIQALQCLTISLFLFKSMKNDSFEIRLISKITGGIVLP